MLLMSSYKARGLWKDKSSTELIRMSEAEAEEDQQVWTASKSYACVTVTSLDRILSPIIVNEIWENRYEVK